MICRDCSAPISKQSKTGRCRTCSLAATNADPAVKERRRAGIKAKYKDPAYAAKRNARLHAAHMNARKDPETAARLNRNIQAARKRLNDPDVREKYLEGRKGAGAKRSRTCMAWCPVTKIEEYRHLTRSKRILAAEAKRMILADLSPFEKQLERVRQGAGIVEVRPLRRVEPTFTMGGVSSGFMA